MAPIFWEGDIGVRSGLSVDYQRNLFHTQKIFSLDVGVSAAYRRSQRLDDRFVTVSVLPLMRFTLARTPVADVYSRIRSPVRRSSRSSSSTVRRRAATSRCVTASGSGCTWDRGAT